MNLQKIANIQFQVSKIATSQIWNPSHPSCTLIHISPLSMDLETFEEEVNRSPFAEGQDYSSLKAQSGQSIICTLLDNIDSLKSQQPNINISLIWIPRHMDIPGNEKVDQAAKEAAQSRGSLGTKFQHHNLKSSRNDVIRQAAKKEWETEWQNTPGSKQLKKITRKHRLKAV